MSDGLNKVMLLGNLCADGELRFTQGGQAVLNLRIATNESYLDRDKVRQERVEFHSVVVWGKRGEALSKILHKGSQVFIEGGLRNSSYEDKEGVKRYKTEISANEIILCGGKRDGAGEGATNGGGGYGGGRRAAPAPAGGAAPPDDFASGGYGGGGDEDIPY